MAFSSSVSCSRITGEATNGAPSNGTVRWGAISVVTSGGVRDDGTTGGESACIQCVNRKQLTFAKAEKDITTLRDSIKKHVKSLGVQECDTWSGQREACVPALLAHSYTAPRCESDMARR